MRPPYCLCTPYQLPNAWTNIYRSWYAYHDTWAHLNGVIHKSLSLVCVFVFVSPIVARQRLGKNVTAAMTTRATLKELLGALFSMRFVSY
jgi:hypothetical protein